MRETQHLIVETDNGGFHIISSLSRRRDTQIITIEKYTGQLLYTGHPGVDLFYSPQDALKFLSKDKKNIKNVTKCHSIIGYTVIGSCGYLFICTKVSLDLVLPPNHHVYTIRETETITIPLTYPHRITKAEVKNCELMTEFQLKGLHFYCETYDLTRPFPSTHSPQDYTEEFCWNIHLTESFRKIRMRSWCCVLLQGVARSSGPVKCKEKDEYILKRGREALLNFNELLDSAEEVNSTESIGNVNLAIICRKSCLNPGTRYNARGLNDKSSPGNEYESEQILWRSYNGNIMFSTFVWRRGTVPIHWRSELNNAVQDASIIISDKPYENIDVYYKRIVDRYNNQPITIINLLRSKEIHPEEGNLTHHFRESLKVVKKLMAIDQLEMLEFDWHTLHKTDGTEKAVKKLWTLVSPKLRGAGVTTGIMRVSSHGTVVDMKLWKKQSGIVRVNCADSLDRTNLICFFNSIQVLAEQCRQLGVSLCDPSGDFSESWKSLDYTLQQVKDEFDSTLLLKLAEIYVNVGDVCATLYTNTVAMHTSPMREFAQHLGAAPNNTKLIVERRIQNVLKDKIRQQQYEMFLGLNLSRYFPSHIVNTKYGELRYVSHYPTFIFKSVPKEIPYKTTEERALIRSGFSHHWICPRDFDFIEVQIYLPFYCRVTELALTIRHGLNDSTSPSKMDVFVGTHLDDCLVGFQELNIPRCEDGTKLIYTLPPQISGIPENSSLYDFEGSDASSKMRVVRIIFYGIPPCSCMTMGQIQVFGSVDTLLNPSQSPKEFYLELLKASSQNEVEQVLDNLEKQQVEVSRRKAEEIKVLEKQVEREEEVERNESSFSDIIKDGTAVEFTQDQEEEGSNTAISSTSSSSVPTSIVATDNPQNAILIEDVTSQAKINANALDSIFDDYFEKSRESGTESLENFLQTSKSNTTAIKLDVKDKLIEMINNQDETLRALRNDKSRSLEKYYKFVQTKVPTTTSEMNFTDSLELELARLKLYISPHERDNLLVENNYKIDKFDPNQYIYTRDSKVEKSIRKSMETSTCSMCKTSIKLRKSSCRYCRHSFCKNCMSKSKCEIIEFNWKNPSSVCIECSSTIAKQKEMISEIQEHITIESGKSKLATKNITRLFTELYPPISQSRKMMKKHEKETLCSEFPSSGILSSVDTAANSPPIESILFPPDILPLEYWYAPPGIDTVTIIILLQSYAKLSKMVLLVDQLGYTQDDAPIFDIAIGERLPTFKNITKWTLEASKANEMLEFSFNGEGTSNNTDLCRLVRLTVKLPERDPSNTSPRILHIGRILLYGKVNDDSSSHHGNDALETLAPKEQQYLDEILRAKPTIQRVQLKTESKYVKESNCIDVSLAEVGTVVSGFRINLTHTQDTIHSQVKHIRVSFLYGENEKSLDVASQVIVEKITVPKVEPGASLIFEFNKNFNVAVKLVRFEFLSTYGCHVNDISIPQIFLFSNTVQ
ncbi:SAC9 protein-like protein [Naegleria gruberi]|uniref:SAC9 protein-like protein n=1 Tax=Naegleria gruberi TaxID=5762 RepID=D2UZG8_NAEGR|nr:SAC9 protein-like protein [Naegleria gruberi]EFC49945.1 SAC9 protein-like protein [Naegleria gruberi]|eukprot:XP_002682689.1 SAC9 protein-like protein [Naegleria gruberi strain NEG-M]